MCRFYLFHFLYFFSSDFASMLGVVVCTVYGLMAGLRSVQAFPVVDFVPILVGLSPLPICLTHCPLYTIIAGVPGEKP